MRGIFDFINKEESYRDTTKSWKIELSSTIFFWFDLLIKGDNEFYLKDVIKKGIQNLEKMNKEHLDKKFIYFLTSRKKVRFSTRKKTRYSLFKKRLILYLEIGRERTLQKVIIPVQEQVKPEISITENYITFVLPDKKRITISIHDFLYQQKINIQTESKIHYVGYTGEPSERVIERKHRGISDTFYGISNEDNDFFVYFNLFKVLSITDGNSRLQFFVANSMSNEVESDLEGQIIEKCFIQYFLPKQQEINQENEIGRMKNILKKFKNNYKINSISIHLEVDDTSNYFLFSSDSVKASMLHNFTCTLTEGNAINIQSEFEK